MVLERQLGRSVTVPCCSVSVHFCDAPRADLMQDARCCRLRGQPVVLERQLGEPVTVPCYGDVRKATRRASPLKDRVLHPGVPCWPQACPATQPSRDGQGRAAMHEALLLGFCVAPGLLGVVSCGCR